MRKSHKIPAMTLSEIVVVIAIMAIIATVGFGSLFNYYQTSILNADVSFMISILQRTRQRAISNATSSDYSVKFLTDRFVVYPGIVYSSSSSNNENYYLDNGVIVDASFTNDIITFNNFTGRANQGGSVQIRAFGINKTLNVNSLGIIESIN